MIHITTIFPLERYELSCSECNELEIINLPISKDLLYKVMHYWFKRHGHSDFIELIFSLSDSQKLDLAMILQVATSTIDRWSKGMALPHERIQKLVIAWFKDKKQNV